MNLAHRIELWGDRHHPKWLDILRIVLGIFLCYMGFEILQNMNLILNSMGNRFSFGAFGLSLLSHYIVFAHFMGGFLLTLGLLTRFACLIQIPVLVGAVVLINSTASLFRPFSELWLALLVLLLLVCFLVVGSGPWSLDAYFERERQV